MWTCQGNLIILTPFPFLALAANGSNLMLVVHCLNPRRYNVIARSPPALPVCVRHSPAHPGPVRAEDAKPMADTLKATKQSLVRYLKHKDLII